MNNTMMQSALDKKRETKRTIPMLAVNDSLIGQRMDWR